MLDTSARLLAEAGFDVEQALSGVLGLAMARSASYDAILLDLRLPDMSGLDVLKELRAAGVAAPTLVLTGFGTIEAAVEAMKLGAVDFRQKPLIGDDLVVAVRSIAARGDSIRPYAARRWAEAVVRIIGSPEDPRTVRASRTDCGPCSMRLAQGAAL